MSDNNDELDGLIALGFIALLGYGVYRVLRSFKNFKEGDEVGEEELFDTSLEPTPQVSEATQEVPDEPCNDCGDDNPDRCIDCGLCLSCNGRVLYQCTNCDWADD